MVVVAGGAYWVLTHETADAPADDTTNSPTDATDDATATTDTPDEPESGTTNEASAEPPASASSDTDYVGLTEAEAEELATENDVPFRVVERDGEPLPTTRDYRPGRINAVVTGGVVVSYTVEGVDMDKGGDDQGDPDANKYDFGDPPVSDETDADTEGTHDAIIGLSVAEAEAYAEAEDVPFRIGSVDGEPRPVTMDYRPGRITADVVDGVVTDYSVE